MGQESGRNQVPGVQDPFIQRALRRPEGWTICGAIEKPESGHTTVTHTHTYTDLHCIHVIPFPCLLLAVARLKPQSQPEHLIIAGPKGGPGLKTQTFFAELHSQIHWCHHSSRFDTNLHFRAEGGRVHLEIL